MQYASTLCPVGTRGAMRRNAKSPAALSGSPRRSHLDWSHRLATAPRSVLTGTGDAAGDASGMAKVRLVWGISGHLDSGPYLFAVGGRGDSPTVGQEVEEGEATSAWRGGIAVAHHGLYGAFVADYEQCKIA